MKRRFTSCGHGRDRIIVNRAGLRAWCWRCDGPVAMRRLPRLRRRRRHAAETEILESR